jgi:iron complex outermembrane receptor protein
VKWFSWDATLFYHQYDDLISAKPLIPPSFPFSITTGNGNMGEGYGVETSAQVEMSSCWRVSGSYSYLQLQMHSDAETINQPIFNGQDIEQSSPHNQVYLTSSHDLAPNLELDVTGRYVDTLPFLAPAGRPNVPSYISLDVRLAWRPTPCWELAAVGQNLLESHHREFGQSLSSAEIARGVYGTITRTW